MLSPLARGLFHRAIMESGNCEWFARSQATALSQGRHFAAQMGCDPDTFGETNALTCLRNKSASELTTRVKQLNPGANALSFTPPLPLGGIIDGYFLKEDSSTALNNHANVNLRSNYNYDVPVMIGINKDEGTLFHAFTPPLSTAAEYTTATQDKYPSVDSRIYAGPVTYTAVAADLLNTYYPLSNYTRPINALADLDGDHTMTCPAVWTAKRLSNGGHATYFYEFRQPNKAFLPWIIWLMDKMSPKMPNLGIYHSSELPFVFGITSVLGTPWKGGDPTTMMMMQFWTNFAKTGVPRSDKAQSLGIQSGTWPAFDAATQNYMQLENTPSVANHLKQAKCDYWWTHRTAGFHNAAN